MRGKPLMRGCKKRLTRITPAGAGKTCTEHTLPLKPRDHPRRCGENHSRRQLKAVKTGSPPQVRGKLASSSHDAPAFGITPAGAGKTQQRTSSRQYELGSPPQVRGKQRAAAAPRKRRRITPAGAGKTGSSDGKPPVARDHPRRCGENTKKIL